MSPARPARPLLVVVAFVLLALLWLVAFEAWLHPGGRQSPGTFAVFLALAWPLAVVAFRPLLPAERAVTIALAAALVAIDRGFDLWFDVHLPPPQPTHFAQVPWQIAKAAVVIAASELGAPLADRAPRFVGGVRAVAALVVAAALGLAAWVGITGQRDGAVAADVAVLLGADLEPGGRAGPNLVGRVERAAALYGSGLVPRIVVTGGKATGGKTEAEVARDLLVGKGVPEGAIVLEPRARTTEENFACVARLLPSEGRKVLVVTEPWHMPRALYQAERYGLDLRPAPASSTNWTNPRRASFALLSEGISITFELVRRRTRPVAACPS